MNNSKTIVTENERNAIFMVLTPEECLLLGRSLKGLCEEYKENATLSLDSVIPVLGNYPKIPISHDMDSMLEAVDDMAKYGDKVRSIENFLEYELQRGHI